MIPTGFSSLQIGCNLKSNLECVLLHVQLLNHAFSLAHICTLKHLLVQRTRRPYTPTYYRAHTNQALRFILPETVVLFPSTTFNLSIRLFFNHSLLPAVIFASLLLLLLLQLQLLALLVLLLLLHFPL